MPRKVDERQFVENLNADYEQYQDELFSVKNGFAKGESAFKNTRFPPSKIPFFVHECSEDWYDEVRGFVGRNDVSMPKFM